MAEGQKCPRFPAKIQHRTREDALEHQKRLVFKHASARQPEKSQGLHVYPCQHCGAWHVGGGTPKGRIPGRHDPGLVRAEPVP